MSCSTPSDVQGGKGPGMGRLLLCFLVLLVVGVVWQTQGQEYQVEDCPPTCTCEHPGRSLVRHMRRVYVRNMFYMYDCRDDPHDGLVAIFKKYPLIDSVHIVVNLSHITEAGYMTELVTQIATLSSLKMLKLSFTEPPRSNHLRGDMSSLQMAELPDIIGSLPQLEWLAVYHYPLPILSDAVCNLTSLAHLEVADNSVETLPNCLDNLVEVERLRIMNNNRLTKLPDSFCGMRNLRWLDIVSNMLTALPHCITRLQTLWECDARNNSFTVLPDVIGFIPQLIALDVSHNQLIALPDSMRSAPAFSLRANYNNMTTFPWQTVSSSLSDVQLRYNQISSLGAIPKREPIFKSLDLTGNMLTSMDTWFFRLGVSPTTTQENREYDLRLLNVSHNSIARITNSNGYPSIPDTSDDKIKWKIDLSHNEIRYLSDICDGLNITPERLVSLLVNDYLILENNPLICDCRDFNIYRDLKSDFRVSRSLLCDSPRHLKGVSIADLDLDNITCTIEEDCPVGCICSHTHGLNVLAVDCRNYTGTGLPSKIPSPIRKTPHFRYTLDFDGGSLIHLTDWGYLELVENASFSNNQIEEVPAGFFDYKKKFNLLKLDHNKIETLPLLIDKWPKQMYLGQNNWRCTCVNKATIDQIADRMGNIVDYRNVSCSSPDDYKNERFHTVKYQLCSGINMPFYVPLLVLGTLIVFAFLALGACYAKRVWVYKTFKWRPFNRGGAEEAMKKYDVFISYFEDDSDYIENHILPKLEENGFKVCNHRVHFLAGESIIGNIYEAILNSKRTLVFFSQGYIKSGICMHEFHAALTIHVKNKGNYLVTIKDTDLDIQALDPAMRSFLENFTYIERESPRFWDNLLYSLPVERMNAHGIENADVAVQNVNEFEMGNDRAALIVDD